MSFYFHMHINRVPFAQQNDLGCFLQITWWKFKSVNWAERSCLMTPPISMTKEAPLKVLTSVKGQSVQMVSLSLLCSLDLVYKASTFQLSSGELADVEHSSAHDCWLHSHSFCMPLLGSLLEYETDSCFPAGCCRMFKIHYLDLNSAFIKDCIYRK